jgi:uncharacterized membrane protein (UPF0182 family)
VSFNLPPDPDDSSAASAPLPPRRTRSRALVLTLVVLALLVIVFWIFTGLYTDLLWYRSVGTQADGFSLVFQTQLKIRLLMFVVFGGLMAAAVAVNCWLAYRARPAFRGISAEQQGLDRYRVAIDPYRRVLVILAAGVLGLITGGSAASEWQTALAFFNSQPFNSKDTQFGLDLSFYAFRLPFWRFLVGFGFGIVLVSLVAALLVHYLYGGLRLQTPGDKTTPWARAHIAVLLGLFVLMKAAAYWFDRYELVVKDGPRISGGTYTDINAVLPAKLILFCIAIICALLFFATVVTRNWLAPALGFGLLVLSAIVVGGIYPFFVQSVQVRPSEPDKEAPYIQRNIDATLKAYKLNTIEAQDYSGVSDPKEVNAALPTVRNVRLIDPAVVSPTFTNLQQLRGFYTFPDILDVDRYVVKDANGVTGQREAIIAARELNLNGLSSGQHNFANDHTVYTHGFGFVAAYGNQTDDQGSPAFFESNIPPEGLLTISDNGSRLYFGENSPEYSIVGAPAGKAPVEFDYFDSKGTQIDNTYTGNGGVPMGSLFGRILFATKFGETNILLSDRINSSSQIIWNRDPRDRVQAVAPWLTLDGDAYPAVVDGQIQWIVDGYTTTNGYPYSQRTQLGEATADSVSVGSSAIAAQPAEQVNYIRNSVKAVVDGYTGKVRLYEWDQTDPVLKVWEQAFPGTVQPYDKIPEQLKAHFRYPQDVFKVQRDLYAKYHITDPQRFYSGQDFWIVPDDPTKDTGQAQPPYYLTLQMPGQSGPSFSLTTAFSPINRPTLAAFMAVDADPGADYGTIRVLQLPKSTNVLGPVQVQTNFESDPTISSQLTLLRNGGSQVVFGNLLSLPVGGSLMYVEPVYIRAASTTTYPTLRKVLVSFNGQTKMDDTLAAALSQVLGTPGAGNNPGPTPPPTTGGSTNAALKQALADADKALQDSNAALKAGDWAAYGEAQKRLQDAVALAVRLAAVSPTTSPSGTPSPSTSSSPSPSG